ncbi:RluA family pseudouridine synthase [Lentilactobacillus sp. Marseille-Q4993]|uniref:RluA family pseudouridine synthase n=1 Tax=Lentilactobacillus sp. Marseille-Q4993 TaxID=3039492 RepID=UPI0024BD4F64|nr:RluA family pseudouridine synthase [Lentilactobacillus sp. Marseille-Q4993]
MKTTWNYDLTVSQDIPEMALRQFLHDHLLIPKYLIFNLRKANRVLVNGKYLPMNFQIKPGDNISLHFEASDFKNQLQTITPDYHPITIVTETEDILIVNKRPGDKTHPNQPGESGATINQAAGYLESENTIPYMIHRLDQETSGAVIFGKNPAVVPILVEMLRRKEIHRTYLAWVHGIGLPTIGRIDVPIGRDPDDKRKRKVNGPNSQTAVTNYEVLQTKGDYTQVKVVLETGRTHQIRVHFAYLGYPLVGDPLYSNDLFPNLRLHSWQVKLNRPYTGELITATAPVPEYFNQLIKD